MADNLKNRAPADHSRINIDEPSEVQYRRRQFGCTEQQLRQAVAAVGASADKVSQYLKNKSTPPKGKAQKFQ
ncbi:MAG TPA: DUF3606 domain-containing protein [Burkholderiales bacterium]|jgi:hypothetical protein|nr:DUF3606 domain-containing protein [Burkholderiales bacterium]